IPRLWWWGWLLIGCQLATNMTVPQTISVPQPALPSIAGLAAGMAAVAGMATMAGMAAKMKRPPAVE
ncbi:hypothetical protein, partial [Bifidobacterium jacchi]|uniref:hypothetical protein n=1 Tax=Bifidobacterium jacchi TaxID=2490545 RepID=UPI0019D51041